MSRPGSPSFLDQTGPGTEAMLPAAEPSRAARATTGASVARGGLWSAAARVLPQGYTLLVSVVAARVLGPEGMGRQSFIAFVAGSTTMLATAGLPLSLMRHVGETLGRGRPDQVRDLLGWAWRVAGAGAAVAGTVLVTAALVGAEPQAAWLLAAFACALGVLHSVPSAFLIGAQRFRAASIVGLATGTLGTAATVVVLLAGGGITGLFAVGAAIAVINVAGTGVLARRAGVRAAPVRTPASELRRRVIRYAAFQSIGVVLTLVVWQRSEFFFLARYATDTQIALYSISFSAVTMVTIIPQTLSSVISPAFATLYGAGAQERIRSGYGRALRLLLLVSLPLTAVALALGPAALRLVYGDEYRGTGPVLLVMLSVFPLVPLFGLATSLFVGVGTLRVPLVAGAVAACVDIALAFLLVPRFEALGAAFANAGAQLTAGIPILVFATRQAGPVCLYPAAILRAALASAAAGAAALLAVSSLAGAPAVVAGLAAGLVTLALASLAIRIVPVEDAAWLAQTVGGRLGEGLERSSRLWAR